ECGSPLRCSIQADRQALPSSSHAERPVQGSRRQEYWAADARGPRAEQASKLETRLLLSRATVPPSLREEAVPAFVVGFSLVAACSTTECCGCALVPMASATFAVAFLSFSGALLLKLFNMSTSFFRRRRRRRLCTPKKTPAARVGKTTKMWNEALSRWK